MSVEKPRLSRRVQQNSGDGHADSVFSSAGHSCMWHLSTCSVTNVTKELIFYFLINIISIIINLNELAQV